MQNTELVKKNSDLDITPSVSEQPDSMRSSVNNNCDNCHQPLNGPFCGQCGQQAESTLKYFWVVILHLLDDIFSFDSRAARTILPLVARPGFLTNEYIAGKRVHYVPPLRLYLFVSIVFFITLKFFVLSDSNTLLAVSDNQTSITQIKDQLILLEKNKLKAIDGSPDNTVDLSETTKSIAKFETYLTDINKDYSIEKNKRLIDMTKTLVDLELRQFKDGQALSGNKKERYDLLTSNIAKFKNGEELDNVEKTSTTIGNNADGTLSFDFLSDENNKSLNVFTKSLIKKAENAFRSDATPLVQEVIGKLPQLMFVLLPLFAVLLKIMFIFSKRLYMEHLTVALHSHSFIFFTILLVELLDVFAGYSETVLPVLTGSIEFASKALLIWIPIYLFIMQKRVYKQGYFLTFIKYSFIGTAYMILIGFTGVIAFVWGLTDI
ncbi:MULTISPECIES: DUF3667 domain-containing protein [unclassified Colwellia]|uniref:DUF3667 domain-containing protein n=1 Tax=unclassified Colwellia TaxID=196834 RepID=UPI0015F3A677|nr:MULTISPECIES: DUF3667 domain-containing protein [unclassified Colwellia]MBA6378219.1 DUF3667 domain-containing protein [Colwellia sp. BRX10-7]MBA6385522.1 DUF3667 domain-containing protein [Colwellia sp. BRX10-2]MBA6400649.1 DUF3667 domain-containing protein [Colwellia sp. BRX10-5]MBA6405423.1 DUF3667 domain-containing protein [Colwellia sp. BRX10-1]